MPVAMRKPPQRFKPRLTIYDFLPFYWYRDAGRWSIFVSLPILVAIGVGIGIGRAL